MCYFQNPSTQTTFPNPQGDKGQQTTYYVCVSIINSAMYINMEVRTTFVPWEKFSGVYSCKIYFKNCPF